VTTEKPVRLYKVRVFFKGGKGGVEKIDAVLYWKCTGDICQAADEAIASAKASKLFHGMTFDQATTQEIRSKKVRKEHGLGALP